MDILRSQTITAVDPRIWGRSTWEFLDTIVATYPHENPSLEHKHSVLSLMDSLLILLPCPTCRNHYKEFRKNHSLIDALQSRSTFISFYYKFQKDVADRNHTTLRFQDENDMWRKIATRLRLASAPRSIGVRRPLPIAGERKKPLPRINTPISSYPPPINTGCAACSGSRRY